MATECSVHNWNTIISKATFGFFSVSLILGLYCDWVATPDYVLFFCTAVTQRELCVSGVPVCLQPSSCSLNRHNTELAFFSDTQTKAFTHTHTHTHTKHTHTQTCAGVFSSSGTTARMCFITLHHHFVYNLHHTAWPSHTQFQLFHFVMYGKNKADVPFTIKTKEQMIQ